MSNVSAVAAALREDEVIVCGSLAEFLAARSLKCVRYDLEGSISFSVLRL